MPRYSYSNPARRTAQAQVPPAIPAAIDRKLARPSTAKLLKVDKPSTAKTLQGIPRPEPSRG